MKNKLWLAALLTLAACGGGSGGDAIKFEDADAQLVNALCQRFAACGLSTSVDACVAASDRITPDAATLDAAVGSGKITFDGAAARACYDGLAAEVCEVTAVAYRKQPAACLDILRGSVAEGGACTINQECVSQKCAAPSCNQACCPGTCDGDTAPAIAKAGDSCETAICDEASYCDQIDHTCMPLKAATRSCGSFEECADGLYCLLSGVCGSLPAEGEICDSDGCARSNDYCSADTHVCTAAGTDGAPCTRSSDCSAIFTCDNTQHCSGGIALDAPCRINDVCAPGARCDYADGETTGVCHPRHATGESCVTEFDCVSHKCDRDAGTCLADQVCN